MRRSSLDIALRYLPLVIGCAAIFAVSSMPRPPIPTLLLFPHSDKVMHGVAYAVLGLLSLYGARARAGGLTRGAKLEAALVAVLWGVSDEVHQHFVPGRSTSAADLAADASGALFGVLVVGAWLWRPRGAPRQPS